MSCEKHDDVIQRLARIETTMDGVKSTLQKLDERQMKIYTVVTRYGGGMAAVLVLVTIALKMLGLDIDLSGAAE